MYQSTFFVERDQADSVVHKMHRHICEHHQAGNEPQTPDRRRNWPEPMLECETCCHLRPYPLVGSSKSPTTSGPFAGAGSANGNISSQLTLAV
jgi:hypothetical protein